jgi:predicted dehydrogenase
MSERVRWGVIGSGGIARRRTIPEGIMVARNAVLAGVFDVEGGVNRAVAEQFRAPRFDSVPAMLAGAVDAVYVATPAFLHAGHVAAAARAGKHVLCEKPLGLTAREARSMVRACAAAGVNLGTAFMMRFTAQHRAALEAIQRGDLGRLVYGRAQLSCWYPPISGAWRQDPARGGGGSLIDMGGHCIDLLEMFFGHVEAVSCRTGRLVHPYASEDTAVALLEFHGGALATVDSCFCIPDHSSRNVLEIYGSKGSILAEGTIGQNAEGTMTLRAGGGAAGYDAAQARSDADGVPVAPPPVNPYLAEIEEFSQAILDRREPAIPARLGMRSQVVLSACYRSARTGRRVRVPADR